jgi:hypothetical protein
VFFLSFQRAPPTTRNTQASKARTRKKGTDKKYNEAKKGILELNVIHELNRHIEPRHLFGCNKRAKRTHKHEMHHLNYKLKLQTFRVEVGEILTTK